MVVPGTPYYEEKGLADELFKKGPKGSVAFYVRPNGRSPAKEFFSSRQASMKNKLEGSFATVVIMGKDNQNHERFRPLSGKGVPLWEFKEHDHRMYCYRREYPNGSVQVILLSGWVKDKRGKTAEENHEIQGAQMLNQEREGATR